MINSDLTPDMTPDLISSIDILNKGALFVIYFKNKSKLMIRAEDSKNHEAARQLIGGWEWRTTFQFGDYKQIRPLRPIPTLDESFAYAAAQGLNELTAEHVSGLESAAAYFEAQCYRPFFDKKQINAARRAVVFRWQARALLTGRPEVQELIEALEGFERDFMLLG